MPKKKAKPRPAAWEVMLAHAKKKMRDREQLERLSVGETVRLAKLLRSLEEGDRYHGREEKRGSDHELEEEEAAEREEAARRVMEERG